MTRKRNFYIDILGNTTYCILTLGVNDMLVNSSLSNKFNTLLQTISEDQEFKKVQGTVLYAMHEKTRAWRRFSHCTSMHVFNVYSGQNALLFIKRQISAVPNRVV